jgi:hypothetical protein
MARSYPAERVAVHVHGAVEPADAEYARHRVASVLRAAPEPVLFARVKLIHLADPALAEPALAQASADLNGRMIRAQAARRTMREAVDVACDRLRDRALRVARHWENIRGAVSTDVPHGWRHTGARIERMPTFVASRDERNVVRHKEVALPRLTIDEAAVDMELMEYHFHLFVEVGSSVDSVIFRTGDGGFQLAQVDPQPGNVIAGTTPFTVDPKAAPVLTVQSARARLDVTNEPFLFFRNPADGRGWVIYHRFDGQYGLISPPSGGQTDSQHTH